MDENAVRQHAENHGKATVAGDFKTAGRDLTPEAAEQAPGVMKALPKDLSGSEVTEIDKEGGAYVAIIAYSGDGGTTKVASTWEEREGRPRIVHLRVL
ncbi:MAG: hypothetical protein ACRDK3_04990 [Actinomycetota bacterium]